MADCQLGSSAGILLLESFDKNLDRSISKIKGKVGCVFTRFEKKYGSYLVLVSIIILQLII